jgi:hypothetical protein
MNTVADSTWVIAGPKAIGNIADIEAKASSFSTLLAGRSSLTMSNRAESADSRPWHGLCE